jgi:hypothetical protein
MTVLVVGTFQGDTAKFRQALVDRSDEFATIASAAKAQGCLHHRFGVGDGFVTLIDEWETFEQFQTFFGDPELQGFIATVGAEPGPPDLKVLEAVSSPDQY